MPASSQSTRAVPHRQRIADGAGADAITTSAAPTTSPGTARAILILFALGFLWSAIQMALLLVPHLRAQAWQRTTGTVTASGTHYQSSGDGTDGVVVLDITYAYHVNGVEYHGTRYNLFENSLGSLDDAAYATARQFRTGTVVPVYFDPKQPTDAAIVTALRPFHTVMIVLPLCLLALGVWFFRQAMAVRAAMRRG